MIGLKVRGLACPFGVENSYGETMEPHAFDEFLTSHAGQPLPMKINHAGRDVGTWEKVWATPEGLWCEGTITDPTAIVRVQTEGMHELSTGALSGKDEVAAGRAINFILQAGASVEQAMDLVARMVVGVVQPPDGMQVVEHFDAACCMGLSEISIVKRGAYPGTHVEAVGEANA